MEVISTSTDERLILNSLQEENWDTVITPRKPLFDLKLKELWRHRDLLFLVVKRDFVALYKQTILGPIWFFLQPLLMSLMFTVVFGRFAGIPTDGIPKMVFYLAGLTNWIYFSEVFKKISTTFKDNQQIFGKVYFPRLVMPFAVTMTGLLRYFIQLLLFLGYYFYHIWQGAPMQPNQYLWLLPILIILLALQSLGLGLIFTALTTKYRDLVLLLQFGIRIAMYATPVILPLSEVINKYPDYQLFIVLNPVSSIIETFRYGFTGRGVFEWWHLGYSAGASILLAVVGILIFNRTERNFMDTV